MYPARDLRDRGASQSGAALLEVMIAFVLLTLASLASVAITDRQAATVIRQSQANQAFSVFAAGDAVLRNTANAQTLDGSTITASAAPSELPSASVAPLQSALALLPNAKLAWSIQPLGGGTVCPCTAQQTLSFGDDPAKRLQMTTQTVVGY